MISTQPSRFAVHAFAPGQGSSHLMPAVSWRSRALVALAAVTLAGCAAMDPPPDMQTRDSIDRALRSAAKPIAVPKAPEAAMPESLSNLLLPSLNTALPKASAGKVEPRFDLVISDAPVQQVLTALVADTDYNVLLRPRAVSGAIMPEDSITLRLRNTTVFEALDAMRKMYGFEYTVDGKTIFVQPPEISARLYRVNYVMGQRRGVSDIQVIGGASRGSSSGTGSSGSSGSGSSGGGTGSSSYASTQASAMTTTTKADLWSELEDGLRTLLDCQISKVGAETVTTTNSSSNSSANNNSSGGRADVTALGDRAQGERLRGKDGCPDGRALVINPMTGTILVRGMPSDHRMVRELIRSVQLTIERQVIIEAKIIDVELNTGAQQGINWAVFDKGLQRFSLGSDISRIGSVPTAGSATVGGQITPGTSLGDLLGSAIGVSSGATAFTGGLGMALQLDNFAALINFLETQGKVFVLSSPRISTLNNQKAVIKVGNEEPFVTNITPGETTNQEGGLLLTTPPSLVYQPFFSGISLDVTPQINEDDGITLHVHSLINTVTETQKVSSTSPSSALVPFATNQIKETDSVVRTRDNQVVVIGGLMTESTRDNRSKVPGAGEVPVAGSLFRKGEQASVKREMVILLRPTIIRGEETWADDLEESRSRIMRMSQPAPR